MSIFGITLGLNSISRAAGCSETYFVDAATYTDADVLATTLTAARAGILSVHWVIEWVRISDPTVKGDSVLDNVAVFGAIAGTEESVTQPWTALLTRLEADVFHRGRKYLHGMPRTAFTDNLDYDPAFPQNAAMTTYLGLTGSAPYKLKTSGGYLDVTTHRALRATTHRIGRPFGLLVGRRKR